MSLSHVSCFGYVGFYFLGTCKEDGWEEHLQNDLFYIKCDIKNKTHSVTHHIKNSLLGPFYGAIAVPSVTCCRCRCGHRCAGGVRQWQRATVATPGEWQCKIRTGSMQRLAVGKLAQHFSNASCI